MIVSYCPSSSFRIRVSKLPRRVSIETPRCMLSVARSGAANWFRRAPPSFSGAPDQRVARIFPLRNRRQDQTRRQFRGHVLQAMHRQVDPPVEQRLFDLLGEKPFPAHLRQRHVLDLVAGGFDNLDPGLRAEALVSRKCDGPARARVGNLGEPITIIYSPGEILCESDPRVAPRPGSRRCAAVR